MQRSTEADALGRRALLAGGAAALASTARAADAGPVRIGVLNDQSGAYASLTGAGSVIAAHMAVEDFGATVLGRPIEILVADHQNKVDVGAGIARQWCDTGGVGLIIDVGHSAVALGVQQIVREKNKIAIYTTVGTTQDFYAEDCWLRVDGRLMHDLYLVQVKTPAESKRAWDYYKILSTAPADQAFRPLADSKCPLARS